MDLSLRRGGSVFGCCVFFFIFWEAVVDVLLGVRGFGMLRIDFTIGIESRSW